MTSGSRLQTPLAIAQSENKALRSTAQGASRGKEKEEAQQHEEVKPTFQVIEIKQKTPICGGGKLFVYPCMI